MKLYNIEVLLSFLSDKGFKDENINLTDRDEYYFRKGWNNGVLWTEEVVASLMPEMQTEAEPVRHGEWKISCDGYYPYCSVCREEPKGGNMTKYCPHCGAKMDKEW